jgi:arylsulfatase A-like enzyme
MTESDHRLCRAAYWAMCDHIDTQVGRLMQTLDDTGEREKTLVIFTSDHGEMLGDHGIYIKGPFLYDPAIRIPLIISMPGTIEKGVISDTMIELADLAPTVLDAAGVEREPGMQAKSMWPLLTGVTDRHRDNVYCEYYNSNPNSPPQFCTMVRNQTHKIVVHHGQELGELYDIQSNPEEQYNVWNTALETKAEMLKLTADRMALTADPTPPRVGIY